MFIRRPVMFSMTERIRSRSRKPIVMIVVAPISMPPVPRQMRWLEMRVSSIISTRIALARSGMSAVMPRTFSIARQYAVSWNIGVR